MDYLILVIFGNYISIHHIQSTMAKLSKNTNKPNIGEAYQLIITEKPNAAKKIADALADGKAIKEGGKGAPYYRIAHGNQDIAVTCAVGHLYGLVERKDDEEKKKTGSSDAESENKGKTNTKKTKSKYNFPVFDIEWKPVSETNKNSAFTQKYLSTIKQLAKNASSYVVATDYDIEGEVIGLNIIRFACKQKDAQRMKFSTLTKEDLVEAYGQLSKHLDWGQANAGETRHILDWYWGINTSRALMFAIKKAGMFKILSTGRVQGPALKLIVDKEREIKKFKSEPYWQIELAGNADKSKSANKKIDAWHKEDKFWEKKKADAVMSKLNGAKEALISAVDKNLFQQAPPVPFDLTSLQLEASKTVRISPKRTLEIAQELYIGGHISYPRTSSQQLSEKVGFKKILNLLAKQKEYAKGAEYLLGKQILKPNNGKKTDPAHPAIYPTGIAPKALDHDKKNIYDLIVRRFLATFGEPATRETVKIEIDCRHEIFIAKGTTTANPGWHTLYGRFTMFKEEELPKVGKGDAITVEKIILHDKETQPPPRYTEASIIKELEKRNLGTKATRSEIVDTLYHRGYIDGKSMEATELGIKTCETLEKHCPKIIDEELTRHFELEMEEIRENKKNPAEIIDEAKDILTKTMDEFKQREKEIGEELKQANIDTRDEMSNLGACPACKTGELQIRRGKFGFFAACNKYPECKTKRPQEVCLNKSCPGKKLDDSAQKLVDDLSSGKIEKKCPKCNLGKQVVRKSLYGAFLGCSTYPTCRFVKKLGSFNFKGKEEESKEESNEEKERSNEEKESEENN
ncbi:DNA topoisomerase I [Candidatus Woesearchaeota archaeon]|nr:DNA topoisomerase I [Candidatus Woesearchaeota archaeon]